eukprot:gene8588-6181_t
MHKLQLADKAEEQDISSIFFPEPTPSDMEALKNIYSDMATAIEGENVEQALRLVSSNVGFVFRKNIPKLTEMMLRRYPELRANEYVLQAYYLILNAMEALAAEKKQMVERNQAVLRELVMAAKVSEAQLRSFLAANVDKISSLDFSLFLDAEIQDAEYQSPAEQVLLAIKLNVLEARAQRLGVDVRALPALAASSTADEMRQKTLAHIARYDRDARELLVQSIRLHIGQLAKRSDEVDPQLAANLRDIEDIVASSVAENNSPQDTQQQQT